MPAPQRIERLTFDDQYIIMKVTGKKYRVTIGTVSIRLMRATPKQRETFRFSPAGYTVTWPLLNLEMSVATLLQMSSVFW